MGWESNVAIAKCAKQGRLRQAVKKETTKKYYIQRKTKAYKENDNTEIILKIKQQFKGATKQKESHRGAFKGS